MSTRRLRILRLGMAGPDVRRLQRALKAAGFRPGRIDGDFGPHTEAAVLAFQRSAGLLADGIVGPRTAKALGLEAPVRPSAIPAFTVPVVVRLFGTRQRANVERHLPAVLAALEAEHLDDKPMVLMALATIRAETAGFRPISEYPSRFNTSPRSPRLFDLYDHRRDLGNLGPPDGERFKGRGFVQLTGRSHYTTFSRRLRLGRRLVDDPELANEPIIAARLLAAFLKDRERRIREALADPDEDHGLRQARRAVNGGTHGLAEFARTYRLGDALVPDPV
jgi:peptidoglycan L-alanyl-D-glutamate endopeptidase CwlK